MRPDGKAPRHRAHETYEAIRAGLHRAPEVFQPPVEDAA